MPTIEISSALQTRVATACLTVTNPFSFTSYSGAPILCTLTNFQICSGVRPVGLLTNYSLITSSRLVYFPGPGDSSDALNSSTRLGSTATVICSPRTATATGTATWFVMYNGSGGVLYSNITGTIGTIGSGADLEMSSTSIVSGQQYRVNSFVLTLPSSWTY